VTTGAAREPKYSERIALAALVGIFSSFYGHLDTDLPRSLLFLEPAHGPRFCSLAAFVVNLELNLFRIRIPEVDLPPWAPAL
jgi:hypothetical protein